MDRAYDRQAGLEEDNTPVPCSEPSARRARPPLRSAPNPAARPRRDRAPGPPCGRLRAWRKTSCASRGRSWAAVHLLARSPCPDDLSNARIRRTAGAESGNWILHRDVVIWTAGRGRTSSVDALAAAQHVEVLGDSSGAGLGSLGVVDPPDDRVAVLRVELSKRGGSLRVAVELVREVVWDRGTPLPLVGGGPAAVDACAVDLIEPGATHPAGSDELLSLVAVDPRPPAAG